MPIYEYQCSGCQHTFDLMQKMNDEPIKKCPNCAENSVVRLVSAAAFQLKGTGWYATDFKNKGTSDAKTGSGGRSSGASTSNKSDTSVASPSSASTTQGEKD